MKKNDVVQLLVVLGIGAPTGLGLSFTALSPLVMGGIIAAVPAALLACIIIIHNNKISKEESFFLRASMCAVSTAIGVGLAAAATAISPSIMLEMGSAALAGALIAPISVIAGLLVTFGIIEPIAKKVNEYIISPVVEKCFSSKEEECDLPAK